MDGWMDGWMDARKDEWRDGGSEEGWLNIVCMHAGTFKLAAAAVVINVNVQRYCARNAMLY